jgi:hypothetical protein
VDVFIKPDIAELLQQPAIRKLQEIDTLARFFLRALAVCATPHVQDFADCRQKRLSAMRGIS